MKSRAKLISERLDELENFITTQIPDIGHHRLGTWVADCVAIFNELGVNSDIIRGFMNLFEAMYLGGKSESRQYFETWMMSSRMSGRVKEFFYPNIAFTTARAILKNMEDEERLIPNIYIDQMKGKTEYSHLVSSMLSMESAYQSKDTDTLLSSTHSLLQSLFNLHEKLYAIDRQGFKKQLEVLMENKTILEDFGIDKEIISTIYVFKYLRDKTSQHKKSKTKIVSLPKPPISVGCGYATLALLIMYGMISRGKLLFFD